MRSTDPEDVYENEFYGSLLPPYRGPEMTMHSRVTDEIDAVVTPLLDEVFLNEIGVRK